LANIGKEEQKKGKKNGEVANIAKSAKLQGEF
jgi:hypothetical protein